jgi:hypothetical protein
VCVLTNKESNFMIDGRKQMPTGGPRPGLGVVTSQVGIIDSMGSPEIDGERASPHGPSRSLAVPTVYSPHEPLRFPVVDGARHRASHALALDSASPRLAAWRLTDDETKSRARALDAVPVRAAQAKRTWQGRGPRGRRRTLGWQARASERDGGTPHAARRTPLSSSAGQRLPPTPSPRRHACAACRHGRWRRCLGHAPRLPHLRSPSRLAHHAHSHRRPASTSSARRGAQGRSSPASCHHFPPAAPFAAHLGER